MLERARSGDPRVDWRVRFVEDVDWMVHELCAYQAEMAELVRRNVEYQLRAQVGDMALPESVPFRRVVPDVFEWPSDCGKPWGMGTKATIAGVQMQVGGGVRFPNDRFGVIVRTGARFDTHFTLPVEWFDVLYREAVRGEG